MNEAEDLAVKVAQQIEPTFSAPSKHIAVWGGMLITALWIAVGKGGDGADYLSMAAAGAERVGPWIKAYQAYFGTSEVAWHAVHAYAVRREPAKALKAAGKVHAGDLLRIKHCRHLIDLAQAHVDVRQPRAAVMRLREARDMSPVWFRHMEIARSLVIDLRGIETRPSPMIRRLAHDVGLD